MELTGILRAISYGVEIGYESILIKTDSQYCIGVLTGEYKVKKNKELINEIHELISYANSVDISVDFEWVRGHDGDMGNESADYYANRACRGV
jgi:ribonuclease HI